MYYNMKKRQVLCTFALILLALSCDRSLPEGYVDFIMEQNDEVRDMTKSKLSEYASLPSASDFNLQLKDSNSGLIWSGQASDWNPSMPLVSGSYTVTATYGSNTEEGFEKPSFSGSRQFSIAEAGSQQVTIPVSLTNCLVRVSCSDNFENYFTDYSFTITTGAGNVLNFPKGENRAAFLDAYKFTVSGEMTNQNGVKSQFTKEYANLEEACCYTLSFDVNSVGGTSITISFDDTTETVDLGTIDLNK